MATDPLPPSGDTTRQAVASLRGYGYQLYASAIEWLKLAEDEELYLEVAEDYAIVSKDVIEAVQVKDTAQSGTFTSNSTSFATTLESFVDLVERNPRRSVRLRYLTTSEIGLERNQTDRIGGGSVISFWRQAAAGAPMERLREQLLRRNISTRVRAFIESRSDQQLRDDLIRKVAWECGSQNTSDIEKELAAGLAGRGRSMSIPAFESEGCAPHVLVSLLRKAVAKSPSERRLTKGELDKLLDEATRVSVPRAFMEEMQLQTLRSGRSVLAGSRSLIDVAQLSFPVLFTRRTDCTQAVRNRISAGRIAWLHAGAGFGKTLLARQAARDIGGDWRILPLRGLDKPAVSARVQEALEEVAIGDIHGLILDDLSLSEITTGQLLPLLTALRRNNVACIVTAYRLPSEKEATDTGIDVGQAYKVREFSEQEIQELVSSAGGNGDVWAKYISLVTGGGHPQLTIALIRGLQAANWPQEEFKNFNALLGNSTDIERVRADCRRRLVEELPESQRVLLARVALAIGGFDRALAFKLADAPEKVVDASAALDLLVGPWIDQVAADDYEVSPLVENLGTRSISVDKRAALHEIIAEHLVEGETLRPDHVDKAYLHARISDHEAVLTKIAYSIITARDDVIPVLSGYISSIRIHRVDQPLAKNNVYLNCLLRLSQVLLSASSRNRAHFESVVTQLDNEIEAITDQDVRDHFRLMAISKLMLLKTPAGPQENFIHRLVELNDLLNRTEIGQQVQQLGPDPDGEQLPPSIGMLFAFQAFQIDSVESLWGVVSQLDQLNSETRIQLLSGIDSNRLEAGLFLNGPWLKQVERGELEARSVADRYGEMARVFETWGHTPLLVYARIAQAVMHDEYAKDRSEALRILDEAEASYGKQAALIRARARIHLQAGEHAENLSLLRQIRDLHMPDEVVEQSYLRRDMAVSAATLGDWAQAAQYFRDAFEIGEGVEFSSIAIMNIGFLADEAVARWKCGETRQAVSLMEEALQRFSACQTEDDVQVKLEDSLRLLAHTILWMESEAAGEPRLVDGEEIRIVPGMVSNPDKHEQLKERVLPPIEYQWYMLAIADSQLPMSSGIFDRLDSHIKSDRRILPMEQWLLLDVIRQAVRRLDVRRFIEIAPRFISVVVQTSQDGVGADLYSQAAMSPVQILSDDALRESRGRLEPFLVSLLVVAAIRKNVSALAILAQEKGPIWSEAVQAILRNEEKEPANSLEAVAQASLKFASYAPALLDINELYSHCVRMFVAVAQTEDFCGVMPELVVHLESVWSSIISEQKFRLREPATNVPSILSALDLEASPSRKGAALLLALEPVLSISLGSAYRGFLQTIRDEK